MSKRKHDEISRSPTPSNSSPARALRLQCLQLSGLLDQSKTSLFRSLKVARGFERQKLGRRQKTAKTENDAPDTARLEAEVAALKRLDLASTAELHLYKSLLKTRSIATAPAFPHHVQATIDASKKPQETASANVQARLFKSGPVQAAMTEALKGVRAVLGIEEIKPNGKKRMRAKDYDNGLSAKTAKVSSPPSKDERSMSTSASDGDEWDGIPTPQSIQENERDEEDEDQEVDYDMYTSRLAQSSDSDSIVEDPESQDHDRDELDAMNITDEEASEDASAPEEDQEDNPNDPDPTPPNPRPKSKRPTAPPKATTFLPSLSIGGYWSGSDSASSSDNDDSSSRAQTDVRKNRMGQQARRALWEKKFGRNANHVKKQARAQDRDRDQGWDARRGAQGVDDGRGKTGRGGGRGADAGKGGGGGGGGGGSRASGRFAKSTGANSDPVVARSARPRAVAAEGPLHPSWEAARRAKEQKKAVPFQGKKVVFD